MKIFTEEIPSTMILLRTYRHYAFGFFTFSWLRQPQIEFLKLCVRILALIDS
jgi:hypothetical protein